MSRANAPFFQFFSEYRYERRAQGSLSKHSPKKIGECEGENEGGSYGRRPEARKE